MYSLIVNYLRFLRSIGKLWMAPVVALLIVVGLFIVVAETSTIAPFLYALF